MSTSRPIVLDVELHERRVGTIANIPGDTNVFVMDDEYRDDPDGPVLSFKAFRDATGTYRKAFRPTRTRLHPYFSNLLPEGHLRTYLARHAGVKSVRDFPLLRVLGRDLPGAVKVVDECGAPGPCAELDGVDGADAERDDVLRFSLAGVQLKFSASGDPKRGLTIPAAGMGGHWIVKMPDQRFKRVSENEFSMMTFARAVGIEVPQVGLVDPASIAGLPDDIRNLTGDAYYIERFDRLPSGARVLTEDFAQANGIFPERKYSQFSFDLLAEQVAQVDGVRGMLELTRRLVFNAGIGNGDMHAKNWSVIYRDGRNPTLAPAYDYLSTILYLPSDDLGMNLLGSKSFDDFDEARLRALADRALVPVKPVIDAAYDMVARMRETWPKIASELPLDAADRAVVSAHIDRIPLFRALTATAGTGAHGTVRRRSSRSKR
jgi:serine/threonine-protein kinase HipA